MNTDYSKASNFENGSLCDCVNDMVSNNLITDVASFEEIIFSSLNKAAKRLKVNGFVIFLRLDDDIRYLYSSNNKEIGKLCPYDKSFEMELKFPFLFDSFYSTSSGSIIKISVNDIPDKAKSEKQFLLNSDINSLIMHTKRIASDIFYGTVAFTSENIELTNEYKSIHILLSNILFQQIDKLLILKNLTEQNNKLDLFTKHTYDIEKWIDENHKLIYISPACQTVTGYSAQEFYSENNLMQKLLVSDDLKIYLNKKVQLYNNELPFDIDVRIKNKNEKIIWLNVVGQKVFDKNKDFKGYRMSFRDISKRKELEIELKKANEHIKELNIRLESEIINLKKETINYSIPGFISQDSLMKHVIEKVKLVAQTNSPVLIVGETGTGKELIARAIHNLSSRNKSPMVTVNCAAIPTALIESELFGREKGAYTGALSKQLGRFSIADNSSIFLDEIGEMPLETQTKLLRILQFGEFQRLGSPETYKVNVRIIAATNKDLKEAINNRSFREDLFYRISVFPINIPPLRERKGDISLLIWEFIREFNLKMGKRVNQVSKQDMDKLINYNWPGNVRELHNFIEYSMIISETRFLRVDTSNFTNDRNFYNGTLEEMEKKYISKILEKVNWKIRGTNGAASILGLNESTLRFRMKKLNISRKK